MTGESALPDGKSSDANALVYLCLLLLICLIIFQKKLKELKAEKDKEIKALQAQSDKKEKERKQQEDKKIKALEKKVCY